MGPQCEAVKHPTIERPDIPTEQHHEVTTSTSDVKEIQRLHLVVRMLLGAKGFATRSKDATRSFFNANGIFAN